MISEKLTFSNPRHLHQLYAGNPSNLAEAEKALELEIATRDDWVSLKGASASVEEGKTLFEILELARNQGLNIRDADFSYILKTLSDGNRDALRALFADPFVIRLKRRSIVPKTINQKRYLTSIDQHPVTFGIGPAGTGKTYLAMASALKALMEGSVERIILTRPAVEAGEALGFLPGDLEEKILPYLTPLYDAMFEMLGKDQTSALMERNAIEIAPLAYMRGRTLANAFVVLDEAQNATHEQMVMFLTRMGDGSRMVVTGDVTQIDLPKAKQSGLIEASRILRDIEGVEIFHFGGQDVVRHPIVQRIIEAYARNAG